MSFKDFVCKIGADNRHQLVHVQVKADKSEKLDTIGRVVQQLIYEGNKDLHLELSFEDGKVFLLNPSGRREITISAASGPCSVKVTQLQNHHLPVRQRTFSEIQKSLLRLCPSTGLFWKLVIYPIALVTRFLFPGQIIDKSSLEGALREMVDLLGSCEDEASKAAAKTFNEGLSAVESWSRSNSAQRQALAGELAQNIINNPAVVIPGGYWKSKDKFEPLLWSFHKNAEGNLYLEELSYGKTREYVFEGPLEKMKLERLLLNLLALSTPREETKGLGLKQFIATAYVVSATYSVNSNNELAEEIPSFINPPKYDEFREGLCVEAGGKPVYEESQSRNVHSKDPMKLVQEVLRVQYPEAAFKDKALFSIHYLHHRVSRILESLPSMRHKERKKWLERLNKEQQNLHLQLEKSAYALDLEKTFGTYLHKLKERITELEKNSYEVQKKEQQKLNHASNSTFKLSYQPFKSELTKEQSSVEQITKADRQELDALQTVFKIGDGAELVKILKSLTARTDHFVAQKQYATAIDFYRLIMERFPLFDQFQLKESNQMKEFSSELGKLSQYYWEAKVRTANLAILPDEWIFLLNTEAILQSLIESRHELLSTSRQNSLNPEELCFYHVAEEFLRRDDYNSYTDLLSESCHLRINENPELFRKFETLHKFLTRGSRSSRVSGHTCATFEIEKEYCKAVLVCVKGSKFADNEQEIDELWKLYYRRDNEGKELSIPSQFSDIGRQRLLFCTMVHPTAISFEAITFKGLKEVCVSTAETISNKPIPERIKKTFNKAVQTLQSFERLEIVTARFQVSMVGIDRYMHCIGSRESAIGERQEVTISQSGRATSNQNYLSRPIHQAPLLGNPGQLFGKLFSNQEYRGGNFEERCLVNTLSEEHSQPLDHFLLSTLKGLQVFNDNNKLTYETVHEVFDLILQRPWIIEYEALNALGIKSLEAQKRFYDALFSPELIQNTIKNRPEFFEAHGPALRQILEKFLEDKESNKSIFLLYLLQSVANHLPNASQAWPTIHQIHSRDPQKRSYLELAFGLWAQESKLQKKIDEAGYLISLFSNGLAAHELTKNPFLRVHGVIAQLLQMGSFLGLTKESGTLPIVCIQGERWVKEHLVPYILSLDEPTRNAILNIWISKQFNTVSLGGWKESSETSLVFEKEGTCIDLATLQILSFNHQPVNGIETTLPAEIVSHPDYIHLFGDKSKKCLVYAGAHPAELVYEFEERSKESYRILFAKETMGLVIERKVGSSWYRYCRPKMPTIKLKSSNLQRIKNTLEWLPFVKFPQTAGSEAYVEGEGIEKPLMASGVWIDSKNPQEGFALLGNRKDTLHVNLTFDTNGLLKSVKTAEGMEIVQGEFIKCLSKDQVLYLKKADDTAITEIRFVDQKIYLKRSSANDPWILHGDENLAGAKWVMGEERGPTAHAFFQKMGVHLDESGLTVRKGNKTYLLFWPQQDQEKTYQAEAPLCLTINDEGSYHTSATGYLALAFRCATVRDYLQARKFLEKARYTKGEMPQEKELCLMFADNILKFPVNSVRSAAFRLKGLLVVKRILEEQAYYFMADSSDYIEITQKIYQAYKLYQSQLKRSPFSLKEEYYLSDTAEINLSDTELVELNHLCNEGLNFLQYQRKLSADEMKFKIKAPSQMEIQLVLPTLIGKMASPLGEQKALELLQKPLADNGIIEHFFELYELIVNKNIKPEQLQNLFGPLPNSEVLNLFLQKSDIDPWKLLDLYSDHCNLITLNVVRRLLLTASVSKSKIDPELLGALKKNIPNGIVSGMIKGYKLITERTNSLRNLHLARALKTLANELAPSTNKNNLKDIKEVLRDKNLIDLKEFKKAIDKDKNLFGPNVTLILKTILESQDTVDQLKDALGLMTVEEFTTFIEQKTEINLKSIIREAENRKRIAKLDQQISEQNQSKVNFPKYDSLVRFATFPQRVPVEFENQWKTVASHAKINLDEMSGEFRRLNQSDKELLLGFESAAETLNAKIEAKRSIKKECLDTVEKHIADLSQEAFNNEIRLRKEIISYLQKNVKNLPRELRRAVLQMEAYEEDEVIQLLKKMYQTLSLDDEHLCHLLTEYLMEQTASRVLQGEVQDQIHLLKKLSNDESDEWVNASTKILNLTNRVFKFNRYLNNDGYLKNPRLYRKLLVLEPHQGIVVTQDQTDLLEKMLNNSADWYELKVGLGKTTVIFLIYLLLLIEQNEFPGAIVKEQLLHQDLDTLDRSTRELLARPGVQFYFDINAPSTALSYQSEYLRLRTIQKEYGYAIATNTTFLSVEHKLRHLCLESKAKIQELMKNFDLTKLLGSMGSNQNISSTLFEQFLPQYELLMQIDDLEKRIYYLSKIKKELHRFVYDEPDDILDVSIENNVGSGEALSLNNTILQTQEYVIKAIFTSKNRDLIELKEALLNEQQASLPQYKLKNVWIEALSTELLNNKDFLVFAQVPDVNAKKLIKMLLSTIYESQDTAPKSFPIVSEKCKAVIGALKEIIQVNLPRALAPRPNIDLGIKSDGYQIGPRTGGDEIQGRIFSDEYDLIANQYLGYAVKLPAPLPGQDPSDSFVARGLKQLFHQHPKVYEKWFNAAKGTPLETFLNQPQNYEYRLEFLRLTIFNEKRLKRFQHLTSLNVQDMTYQRTVEGMSGTVNRECLPRSKNAENSQQLQSKKVVGQVILEAGLLGIPTVDAVDESMILNKMQEVAKDPTCKAILNQGYYIKDGNPQECVSDFREAAPDRIYVYVDRTTKKFFIWYPDENNEKKEPKRISKAALNDLALDTNFKEKALFYFGPSDIRGVDGRIPPGRCVTFISPKCSMDDLVQTEGRARGAGEIHRMDFFVSTSIKKRIESQFGNLSYYTLVEDVKVQDKPAQGGKNLKAALQEFKAIVNIGTRQIIYGHQSALDTEEYWNPQSPLIRIFNNYVRMELLKVAEDPKTGWINDNKEIHPEESFAWSHMENTEETLKKAYDRQIRNIERLESQIRTTAFTKTFINFLPGQLFGINEKQWIAEREKELNDATSKMRDDLFKSYKTALTKLQQKENSPYPHEVPSNGAALPIGQAQEQQIQQQQQQQLQQQQQIIIDSKEIQSSKCDHSSEYKLKSVDKLFHPDKYPKINEFWKKHSSLQITKNFRRLFARLSRVRGNLSLCRLMVREKHYILSINYDVSLVSKGDYHFINMNKHNSFYSFVNPKTTGGKSLLLNKGEDVHEKILQQLVEAKWLLGITDFTDQELAQLKNWLKNIKDSEGHMEFLTEFAPDQIALYKQLTM